MDRRGPYVPKPHFQELAKSEPDEFAQLVEVPGRCNAKLKASRHGSKFCPEPPMRERTRCRMHGGKSKRGAEHPNYKAGGTTMDLPPRIADRVAKHLSDPELTSTLRDISLTSARLDELLAQFETGEAGAAWTEAGRAEGALGAALADLDRQLAAPLAEQSLEDLQKSLLETVAKAHQARQQLAAAVREGDHERALWSEVFDAQKHRAKLVETELKREERLEQTITAKQALLLIDRMKRVLLEVVTDPELRLYAARQLDALVNRPEPKQLRKGKSDA